MWQRYLLHSKVVDVAHVKPLLVCHDAAYSVMMLHTITNNLTQLSCWILGRSHVFRSMFQPEDKS